MILGGVLAHPFAVLRQQRRRLPALRTQELRLFVPNRVNIVLGDLIKLPGVARNLHVFVVIRHKPMITVLTLAKIPVAPAVRERLVNFIPNEGRCTQGDAPLVVGVQHARPVISNDLGIAEGPLVMDQKIKGRRNCGVSYCCALEVNLFPAAESLDLTRVDVGGAHRGAQRRRVQNNWVQASLGVPGGEARAGKRVTDAERPRHHHDQGQRHPHRHLGDARLR